MAEPLRILIAEGSTVVQRALAAALADRTRYDIVGMTAEGDRVAAMVNLSRPQVLLLGFGLHRTDVWEVLPGVMKTCPVPVVVLREADATSAPEEVEKLTRLGAVAVARKPPVTMALEEIEQLRTELAKIVEQAARVKVMKMVWHVSNPRVQRPVVDPPSSRAKGLLGDKSADPPSSRARFSGNSPSSRKPFAGDAPSSSGASLLHETPGSERIVLVGASTGGPSVLVDIFRRLDGSLPVPIVVAQHMPDGLISDLVRYLNGECKIPVVEARTGARVKPGTVYMCPGRCHLWLRRGGVIALQPCESKLENSPSVDILFRSGADSYGRGVLAVVLTGMGSDGAEGVRAVKAQGGLAVAQDEASCVVYGMPKEAAATGELDAVSDAAAIAAHIRAFGGQNHADEEGHS